MNTTANILGERRRAGAQTACADAAAARFGAARSPSTAIALDLLATCLDVEGAQAATMACVNEIATRCACERVSYGRVDRRGRLRVAAVSNSARLAERSNQIRAIEAAMSEAVEQGHRVVVPATDARVVADREHAALAHLHGDAPVLTVPIAYEGTVTGAITLERSAGAPFDTTDIELAETLAVVAGPMLELKYRDAEPLARRVGGALGSGARAIAGPRRPGIKIALAAALGLLAFLSLASGTYRVTAPAQLEGRINRAIVAPIDGFVSAARVRAGDKVEEGIVMARLDDRDLKVELSKWQSESAQLRKQHRGARAAHDRAESAIVSARMDRANAQIALIESQLARTAMRAPFDGLVVSGDLSQLLGSPVARGDVLFEIAPLNDYRVVLEVDERDVAQLMLHQGGKLALEGLPGDPLSVVVDKITPVAIARDGRNYFRVEASVDGDASRLRPGMAGIAKIDAAEARLIWIWTHRVVDWLRLRVWAWLP